MQFRQRLLTCLVTILKIPTKPDSNSRARLVAGPIVPLRAHLITPRPGIHETFKRSAADKGARAQKMRKVSRAPLRLQCVSKKNYSLLLSLSSYLNMQRAHGSAYYFMPFFRSHTATSSSSFAYLRPPGQRAQVITAATTMRASASKQDVSRRNSQTDKYVRCHPW